MSQENAWRAIVAALGNPTTRRVYAQIVLSEAEPGTALSPSRRAHALDSLEKAGLIAADAGGWVARDEAFARALAQAPRAARRTGVDRFLTPDGRIDRYPAQASDRRALLGHIASRALAAGEVVDEAEITLRLAAYADDPAALRRHLVDAELIERTRSGSEYALTSAEPPAPHVEP